MDVVIGIPQLILELWIQEDFFSSNDWFNENMFDISICLPISYMFIAKNQDLFLAIVVVMFVELSDSERPPLYLTTLDTVDIIGRKVDGNLAIDKTIVVQIFDKYV